MATIEDILKKEYRATVVVIGVGLALLGSMGYMIVNAQSWVEAKAQAATVVPFKSLEKQAALVDVAINDHAARIQKLEQAQGEQHDLLLEMKSDLKYLRQDADRKRGR